TNPIEKVFDVAVPRFTAQLNVAVPTVVSAPDDTLTVPRIVFVPRSKNWTCALRISPAVASNAGSPTIAVMSFTVRLRVTVPVAAPSAKLVKIGRAHV